MKYTFETEDETEARMLMAAQGMFCALWDLREEMRQDAKYLDDQRNGQHWRCALVDTLAGHGIDLDGMAG